MKKWLKQLFCFHVRWQYEREKWVNLGWPHIFKVGDVYSCKECGHERTFKEMPVSML